MPRPKRFRKIRFDPNVTYFKPQGIPLRNLEEVMLSLDEIEALRLQNIEELPQEESAKMMHISQPTFFRILKSARNKVTDALINGKAIKIENNTK